MPSRACEFKSRLGHHIKYDTGSLTSRGWLPVSFSIMANKIRELRGLNREKQEALCVHPKWQAADLGKALPDSPHATSVCLPLWSHVVGYEEGDPAVRDRLATGYPRFIFQPAVQQLFAQVKAEHGDDGEDALVFPSLQTAERCVAFMERQGATGRIVSLDNAHHAVLFPEDDFLHAKGFWQHFGYITSSRRALSYLEGRESTDPSQSKRVKQILNDRLAGFSGMDPDDVWLYPSGMAAMSDALRATQTCTPGAKTIQLGFPYVDGLKIQRQSGAGCHFIPAIGEEAFTQLEALLKSEPIAGVFSEVPGNPLLQCFDVPRLSELLHQFNVPFFIDDTVATFANVDLLAYVDGIATSLTKLVSGKGDVIAGSLILNSQSPLHEKLQDAIEAKYEDLLWYEDAVVLEQNSRDFLERSQHINTTAEALCDWLNGHSKVERVHYPKYESREAYDAIRRPDGGYGGLFSVVLKDAEVHTPKFFDALAITKGPSLGTNFSLACPFTLLAHYHELDWAEEQGVSRWLIRISIGLESLDDLKQRFTDAFEVAWR